MMIFYSKHSKLRLTRLAAGYAVGEKLHMFVIGKSKQPRCFKHVKKVFALGQHFTKEGRKIALLIDNCPAHPFIDNLVSIELIFLPPNTTSKVKPMDKGIIRSLKAYYKALLVREEQTTSGILYTRCLMLLGERSQLKLLVTAS